MAFLPADGRGSRPKGLQIGILSHIVNPRKQGSSPVPSDGSHPHAFNLVRNLSVPQAFCGGTQGVKMSRATISTQFSPTRRHLLIGGSTAALAAFAQWPGAASAAELDPERFLALSERLTRKDDLSADLATSMLEAFKTTGKANDLTALANGDDNQDLANEVVAAWYSGVSPDPDSNDVLTYTDALMWQAMTFSKPMGYCGGAMGYWAEPPAG